MIIQVARLRVEWSTPESLPPRCHSAYLPKEWKPGRLVPQPITIMSGLDWHDLSKEPGQHIAW
jgi:hypothetical protein